MRDTINLSSIKPFSFISSYWNLKCILMLLFISPTSCYTLSPSLLGPNILFGILVWNILSLYLLIDVGRKSTTPVKIKFSLSILWKHIQETRGITPFWNWRLDGGKWLTSCPGHFAPLKEPRHPLNTRVGGPQNWSGYFGENKYIMPLTGF